MAVTTHPLTGVFDADRTHSSFQFAVGHMKVSTFRASFGDARRATRPTLRTSPERRSSAPAVER